MTDEATVPLVTPGGLPVRALEVEVLSGPDAGARKRIPGGALSVGTANSNDLRLTDPTVSRFHLELRPRPGGGVSVVDLGSTNGTVVSKATVAADHVRVVPGATLALGGTQLRIVDGGVDFVRAGRRALTGGLGSTPAMRQVGATLEQLADKAVSVLFLGESGTGKEVAARLLHSLGPRKSAPFVVVDCGAIPTSLFASELFGHEAGAFTGARSRRAGAFERAEGGTLLLDEIGELSPQTQTTLLGALERRSVRRLGGDVERPFDVRVLCATHRDLRGRVNTGAFRLDLYYRLAVVLVHLPPLRERTDDVPALVERFCESMGSADAFEGLFPPAVLSELQRHEWPGNIRELRNVVSATLALGRVPSLDTSETAPAEPTEDHAATDAALPAFRSAKAEAVAAFERGYLKQLLDRSGGSVRGAARLADMDRKYLTTLLRKHGLS